MKQIIKLLLEIKHLLQTDKEVLTIREFANYAGISIHTAYKYTSLKKIRHYKLGKHIYIKKDDVLNFLLSNPILSDDDLDRVSSAYMRVDYYGE